MFPAVYFTFAIPDQIFFMYFRQSSLRSSFIQPFLLSLLWLVLLVLISLLSYYLRNFTNSLLLFLPLALGIVLVHWYGYKILPVIYINGIITLFIWRASGSWTHILLIATHEPMVAFISRLLVSKVQKKAIAECFGSVNEFVLFIGLGLLIPVACNSFYTYHYSFVNGDVQKVSLLFLSDFITSFSLSLPLLYFFRPQKNGWLTSYLPFHLGLHSKKVLAEFWMIVIAFVIVSFLIPFEQYWFLYGIVAVVIGVRQGFEAVLLINIIIFLVNYLLPLIEKSTALITAFGSTQLINVHLGNATMLFISTLVGRVISDLKATEKILIHQKEETERTNLQLNRTNQELDRFVYSVSHDLSAPLKSIQGLIHLSRMENKNSLPIPYLDMMEKSTNRLNIFINEVLEFSQTSRKGVELNPIYLSELINELKEKFIFHEEHKSIRLKIVLQYDLLITDATLLKIALGNLLSNAIKFQKTFHEHIPVVEINSFQIQNEVHIEVTDNGEGIRPIHAEKVFEMFYRATSKSPGSGLGLYIAREAIAKLGGKLIMKTSYGEGSTFTIVLPVRLPQLSSL